MSAGCSQEIQAAASFRIDQTEPKRLINQIIWQKTKGVVLSGPFKGIQLLERESWPDGNLGTMALGCYEQELHEHLERAISYLRAIPTAPQIVNVGCAEGYYAVGLGRRLPKSKIWIVDVDDKAIDIAHANAQNNGVELISGDVVENMFRDPDLIVMDCEGSEVDYLDLDRFPALARARIIVECHDAPERSCNEILYGRFKATHSIKVVLEGARNPNTFEFTRQMSSIERWLAVSENRPCLMNWLVMNPRQPQCHPED